MKPKKQNKQEDISTGWDIQLPEWEIDLSGWEIDISCWDIEIPDWDSLLSKGWDNATDKTDNRKQAESPDNAE